jgi:transposase
VSNHRFDEEGVDGLRLKPGRGRRCRLSEEQQYQIQGDLLKSPEEFGYNTANWTGALLQAHIFKTYRVEYKLASTYNLMKKLGFSYQRAKAFYPERDEVKRTQVKAEIKKN